MILVYDIEIYKNYFCVGFEEFKGNSRWQFEISKDVNQYAEMVAFIRKAIYLIGYNNAYYDDVVIMELLKTPMSNSSLYELSQNIINGLVNGYVKTPFRSIDLMTLHASTMGRVSLKEMEVLMCWHKVQDLPYPFDEDLSREMMDNVAVYNFNDIGATHKLAILKGNDIDLRRGIERKFGLECLSKDAVNTGVSLFAKMYAEKTGSRDFMGKRTFRPSINLGECILDNVRFNSVVFNDLLTELKSKTITETKGSLKYSVIYGGVKHVYGTGGIHTKDKPGKVAPKPGYVYMDADVSSLYPSLWIQYGWCPDHLDASIFIPLYKQIRDDRVNKFKPFAKKDKEMALMADTYKLMLNGSYGKLISEYSWLYDPMVAMSITLNGQLFLSMLSERLTDAGFNVDSLNTDGITTLLPETKLDLYYSICREWEVETLLELEYTEYERVIRRDVNSYLAVYKGGGVKEKGFFIRDLILGKGYDKPIVKIALYEYFINGVDIRKTIESHDNIYSFCMMQKMGSKFKALWNGESQQKTNRFYASKKGAYLYKVNKEDGKQGHVLKDSGVVLMNDYVAMSMVDREIDYEYYIRETMKIVRLIEPEQLSLF